MASGPLGPAELAGTFRTPKWIRNSGPSNESKYDFPPELPSERPPGPFQEHRLRIQLSYLLSVLVSCERALSLGPPEGTPCVGVSFIGVEKKMGGGVL